MSGDRPTGAELLAIAAQVLRREVLPGVPADQRLATLMVLRSMAIAEREAADAGVGAAKTERAIARLYETAGMQPPGSGQDAAGRLAADIRAGRFDGPGRAQALHALLLADAAARLRIANPKYLDDAG